MALSRKQIVGILLLVALAMLYVDVPFVDQQANVIADSSWCGNLP